MKRGGFTLLELLVVVVILGGLAAIFIPVFNRAPHDARRRACQSNLKQITLGFKQYLQDSDEKFPPVDVARSGNWAGSLQPYLKSWRLFQCPVASYSKEKATDYFYNARVAQTKEKTFAFPAQTILLGDGRADSQTNYALSELPLNWRSDENSPVWRHLDGANYAFADGHVKWLKPQKIKASAPADGVTTFAIR